MREKKWIVENPRGDSATFGKGKWRVRKFQLL